MEKTSVALTLVGLNLLSVHLDAMTPASMFSGFLRIADTNTTIPATSGTFDSLSSASFGDGFVTFEGVDGSAINRGLYRSDGTSVTTIVDFNDNIPGLTDTFDQFIGQASLFNGNTLVSVDGTPATFFSGIVSLGASSSVLLDNSTPIPNTSPLVNFNDFGEPIVSGNKFVFSGSNDTSFQGGYYLYESGSLTTVLDRSTLLPGTDMGSGDQTIAEAPTGDFDYDGTGFAVRETASDLSTQGIFLAPNLGSLNKIIVTGDAIPGTDGGAIFNGTIGTESQVVLSDGSLFFTATDTDMGQYILRDNGFGPLILAQTGDLLGGETIMSFGSSIEGGEGYLFFTITTDASQGLYSFENDELSKVLDFSTGIDGQAITDLTLEDFNEGTLVFSAEFQDFSQGIFTVSVPEPSTYALLILGASVLFLYRRKCS